ncbi:MAG: WbqC family protein [Candidatus Babeliales bacterium]|jgi:hypothetical protein
MKILTAHQTAYLPWMGLIHKISLADKYVFFDCVQMSNDDYERRNRIKTANGEIWLTIPLKSKGYREKKLFELEIDNSQRWRDKHRKSIYYAYKKAPYFDEYESFFNELFQREWQYLCELNEYFLKWVLDLLKINVEYCRASDLNFEGQKSDLVLDMCKKLGADVYIFGSQGEGYADKEAFERAGIKLYFQNYNHPVYPQLWGEFVPYMSIIDLLFNVDAEKSKQIIMSGNISKKELL